MPLNLFHPATLVALVEENNSVSTFLRDRFFSHNPGRDIFSTSKVYIEYKKGNRKMAPFVAPRVNGVTLEREGYMASEFSPGRIAPRMPLTEDVLMEKRFAEAFYSDETPEMRSQLYMVEDLEEMDRRITRREEQMAAETMLNNGIIMRHETGKDGVTQDIEIRFYEGASNPSNYTPAVPWSDPAANIIGDIAAMASMLEQGAMPATDLIVPPNVANYILMNDNIQKQLDIRNFNIGSVDPKDLGQGAALIATLTCNGRIISVISYGATYEDDMGVDQLYIPSGTCILTAPNSGRSLYGAVTRINKDTGIHDTFMGRRNPRVKIDEDNNSRDLIVESKPLLTPRSANPWVSSNVE